MSVKTRRRRRISSKRGTLNYNVVDGDAYLSLVVDVWAGDPEDPATEVSRFFGVWRRSDLDGEAQDLTISQDGWYDYEIKPKPLLWELIETTKEADDRAIKHQQESEHLLTRVEGYDYSGHNRQVDLYEAFLDAIERVAKDENDEEAWEIIERWRSRVSDKYEK